MYFGPDVLDVECMVFTQTFIPRGCRYFMEFNVDEDVIVVLAGLGCVELYVLYAPSMWSRGCMWNAMW